MKSPKALGLVAAVTCVAAVGCGPKAAAPAVATTSVSAAPDVAADPAVVEPAAVEPAADESAASDARAAGTEAAAAASAPTAARAPAAAPPAAPAPATAEGSDVVVKNIGLHVGGGPNDAKTKAPLQQAVEKRFEAFRQCYALTDGKKSGTVGADLFIAAAGGAPKVRALRISFRGKEIRACIETAFGTVEFPSRQVPVVISYSLSFTPKP